MSRFVKLVVVLLAFPCATYASGTTGLQRVAPAESAEVVIKTCKIFQHKKLAALLGNHALQVERWVSPTMVVVQWEDGRRPDVVIGELNALDVFCGVQKNYRYQTTGKSTSPDGMNSRKEKKKTAH